ncbi:MAG: DUF2283 domain-containing protein [Leptospiraceae bacterium]|nr:DUF2283 domain-containing protein [Leptospiraceae bacterium]
MGEVIIYFDKFGNTLTVWFGDPNEEHIAEETGDDMVLMKNKEGKVIGFEKWNLSKNSEGKVRIALETFA